jgi:hypothetical protein
MTESRRLCLGQAHRRLTDPGAGAENVRPQLYFNRCNWGLNPAPGAPENLRRLYTS